MIPSDGVHDYVYSILLQNPLVSSHLKTADLKRKAALFHLHYQAISGRIHRFTLWMLAMASVVVLEHFRRRLLWKRKSLKGLGCIHTTVTSKGKSSNLI